MSEFHQGFGPMPYESLHSFICRVLLRGGYSCFHTVIVTGGWGDKPSIPFSAKHEFEFLDRYLKLDLYEKTFIQESKHCSIFSSPVSHIESFEKTFYPLKDINSCGNLIKIRFCDKCIKEQIKEFGFSYFKYNWLTNDICENHQIAMQSIDPRINRSKLFEVVKDVFSGKDVDEYLSKVTDDISLNNSSPLSEAPIKFAPCTKPLLVNYLRRNNAYYPYGYTETVDYGLLTNKLRELTIKYKRIKEVSSSLENHFKFYLEFDSELINKLLMDSLELYLFSLTKNNLPNKRYNILKARRTNCSLCKINISIGDMCPVAEQNQIYWKRNISILDMYIPPRNICDEKLSEVLEQVYSYQDELGVGDGECLVAKDIEKSNLYSRYGGKHSYSKYLSEVVCRLKF